MTPFLQTGKQAVLSSFISPGLVGHELMME